MPGPTFYGRRALRLRRYIFRGCENWDPFRPARLHRDYSFHGRETWAAAASRLETLVEKYPGPDDDQYLFRLHDLYSRLKDQNKARDALQRIITRVPGTPAAEKARQMLGS